MIAFAICQTCGDVVEFSDGTVRERLEAWTARNGFSAVKTTMEIRGICNRCAASGGAAGNEPKRRD
jgi:Fur family zinc uptake transcriptional regulator